MRQLRHLLLLCLQKQRLYPPYTTQRSRHEIFGWYFKTTSNA
jgi:hypothetical protein